MIIHIVVKYFLFQLDYLFVSLLICSFAFIFINASELGNYIKEYRSISRNFSVRDALKLQYISVGQLVNSDMTVSASVTLKLTYELFRSLDVLQRAYLFIGNLDNDTMCVRTRNGKVFCYKYFQCKPSLYFVIIALVTQCPH
jgi:hypothetical protein